MSASKSFTRQAATGSQENQSLGLVILGGELKFHGENRGCNQKSREDHNVQIYHGLRAGRYLCDHYGDNSLRRTNQADRRAQPPTIPAMGSEDAVCKCDVPYNNHHNPVPELGIDNVSMTGLGQQAVNLTYFVKYQKLGEFNGA